MRTSFPKPSAPPCATELLLQELEADYRKLPDGSLVVKGNLSLDSQGYTQLPDLSNVTIEGGFSCAYNKITDLKGAPKAVLGYFSCYNNPFLQSLTGAPAVVGSNFSCHDAKLASLEGAPRKFKTLISDFGRYKGWDEVPEDLRVSPETKAENMRKERAKIQLEQDIRHAVVLQGQLSLKSPLKLKRPKSAL